MTYSIVARDPETGALGVAVQTAWLAVGSIVPWARPGIGAVATQSFAEPAYGARVLAALAEGLGAQAALDEAVRADDSPSVRQVGVVGADGSTAVWTGASCIDYAGHVTGDGFTVQANMMASDAVWPAMAEAYLGATGAFPQRLLATLVAAQAAGGDARGVMSAAMLVVDGARTHEWAGRLVDVRVDQSADPLGELAALLAAADAYKRCDDGYSALDSGAADTALADASAALAALPGDENVRFLRAGALFAAGDIEAGRRELRALVDARPSWLTILRSFAEKGLLQLPPGLGAEDLLA